MHEHIAHTPIRQCASEASFKWFSNRKLCSLSSGQICAYESLTFSHEHDYNA